MARVAMAMIMAWTMAAGVIDRVAVTVGNQVITETEVIREVRLTQLENAQPLDLTPAVRRAAAERLVDQQLIRTEMEVGGYPKPDPAEADALLRQWRGEHYADDARFHAALSGYGVTEEQLKQRLMWQAAILRFTDLRFHIGLPERTQSADRSSSDNEAAIEQELDKWLKQQRASTRIQFKKAAFEK